MFSGLRFLFGALVFCLLIQPLKGHAQDSNVSSENTTDSAGLIDIKGPSRIDANGVDMATGQFSLRTRGVSIGVSGQGGLSFYRVYSSSPFYSNMISPWSHNHAGGVSVNSFDDDDVLDDLSNESDRDELERKRYIVSFAGVSVKFRRLAKDVYEEVSSSGASLERGADSDELVFTGADGTIATFDRNYGTDLDGKFTAPIGPNIGDDGKRGFGLVKIERPNGEIIEYHYAERDGNRRLTTISNNYGNLIYIGYGTQDNEDSLDWFTVDFAVAMKKKDYLTQLAAESDDTCQLNERQCLVDTQEFKNLEDYISVKPGDLDENGEQKPLGGHYYALHQVISPNGEITEYTYRKGIRDEYISGLHDGKPSSIIDPNNFNLDNLEAKAFVTRYRLLDGLGGSVGVSDRICRFQMEAQYRVTGVKYPGSQEKNITFEHVGFKETLSSKEDEFFTDDDFSQVFGTDSVKLTTLNRNCSTHRANGWFVSKVTGGGRETRYTYDQKASSGRFRKTTTTERDGTTREIEFDRILDVYRSSDGFFENPINANPTVKSNPRPIGGFLHHDWAVTKITDALNRVTQYDYHFSPTTPRKDFGKLHEVTYPLGNKERYTYDNRGNVTVADMISSGTSPIILRTRATYPDSCTSQTRKICNQPTSIIDPNNNTIDTNNNTIDTNNNTTSYRYDSAHGGVLSIRMPSYLNANGANTTPEVRFSYKTHGGVTVLDSQFACRSSNFESSSTSCSGEASDRTQTQTFYQTLATANDFLLPIRVQTKISDNSVSSEVKTTYDYLGDVITVDGPLPGASDTTRFYYDVLRRPVGQIGPIAANGIRQATQTTYHPYGTVAAVETGTAAAQNPPSFEQRVQGRVPGFVRRQRQDSVYDDNTGLLIYSRVYEGGGNGVSSLTQYSYDLLGRQKCVATRMNPAVFNSVTSTDACKLGPAGDYGPDRIARTSYTPASEVDAIESAVGTIFQQVTRQYDYTRNGKLEYLTDANGNRTVYLYDNNDRLFKICYPPKSGVQFTADTCRPDRTDRTFFEYDANGNITREVRRDGRQILSSYDALNRVTRRELADGNDIAEDALTVHYCYDNQSNVTHANQAGTKCHDQDNGRQITNAYDGRGRLLSQTSSHNNGEDTIVSYGYDSADRRTRLIWPDGYSTSYAYDAVSALQAICEQTETCSKTSANRLIAYSYDNQARVNEIQRPVGINPAQPNGVTTAFSYDSASRLTALAHSLKPASDGNEATLADAGPYENVAFRGITYNPANQILTTQITSGFYQWNAASSGGSGEELSFSINGLNQYTEITDRAKPAPVMTAYDNRANMTRLDNTYYTYDALNRMVRAQGGGFDAGLHYDPADRLTQVTTPAAGGTQFIYDGDNIIAERTDSGVTKRRYIHSGATDNPIMCIGVNDNACVDNANDNEKVWMLSDLRGSLISYVSEETLSTGGKRAVVGNNRRNVYDAFGRMGDNNGGLFAYTGQIFLDDAGLYHYKARQYHPGIGRFMQTDPIGYEDGMNLYAYVGNDPINLSDPTGLMRVPQNTSAFGEVLTGQRLPTLDEAENFAAGVVGGVLGAGSDDRITIQRANTASARHAQIIGGAVGVAGGLVIPGPGGKATRVAQATKGLGFGSAKAFNQFGKTLNSGLADAGFGGTKAILQGSAVTGKNFRTGKAFDAASDFDIALAGPSILAKAKQLGIGLRSGGTRTGPLTNSQINQLGLGELRSNLQNSAGREVNFMIFGDAAKAAARAPSIDF